ncbi:SusD/RagB family nutrient-binding outer membrane lipoprotein [Flavilitoribacter nigricans]|uniref:SusD/RagB family nutrient-binding outer membrane lipoprotein n=1 Tax=Flavilitoribacter nigricans (strain ATCC 23147 / DSM 23189 / NBRC 102662 / NCIMB 1420 / SS-2) TaxID=1122177 RepID=A0A2D0N8M4_FLAN2|nr:SusD/RagB family nutrient-binding outer membrane lipoprotein [Flavilitoribacter nigricans]PHN04123.1 hypothetical protein CRP01_23285 [Flavilitoribacter nigricans DSM 23189 = NBRC 102662]
MKKLLYTSLLALSLLMISCQSLVDEINDNPNAVTADEIEAKLFLTGVELANVSFQLGHLSRISALYSGQLFGFASVYGDVYRYNISTAEANSSWNKIYVGVVTNVRHILDQAPNDALLTGIAKVLEAHAVGTAAAIFGDVPYTEINDPEVEDPVFDSQVAVLGSMQALLDDAINDLSAAASRPLPEDIHFEGDADKWLATAWTLKSRYYLLTGDYGMAFAAAQNGISSPGGSMEFVPRGTETTTDDKNQFWTTLSGSRGGDIGSGDSYMVQLLDPDSEVYRGNAKTNERARSGYSYVVETNGLSNLGIIEQFEPQNLISYEENLLTLAEAGARTQGFDTGLENLNELRMYLNTGDFFNESFDTIPYLYEAYTAEDFQAGGIENMDGIDPLRALLREIIEERYITGFLTWMPFNDHRRLRGANELDLVVPFPLNDGSASLHVGRLPYASDELNANANAPDQDPGIFTSTEVNSR